MANDWIKMRMSLRTDHRVIVAAAKLGKSKAEIIGGLCLLWMIADEHGDFLAGMDAVTLSFEIGVTGLVEVLPEEWVKVTPEGVYFPNYAEHNGSTAKNRALSQTRMAKHRERKRYAPSVTSAQPEKRREEKSTTKASAHENKREPDPVRDALAEVNGETTPGGDTTEGDPQFETFWQHYPPVNKHGRAEAERAWFRLTSAERVKAAATVAAYAKAKATGPPDHRRRVLKPANWLDSRVFDQDPATWLPPQETSKVSAQFARSDDAYFSQS